MLQLGRISFSFGGNAMFCEEEIRSRSEKDALIIDEAWRSLEKRLTEMSDAKTAEKITAAFRDYYGEVYHPDLVLWLANLYDAESGGFYYSNYAKDNEGYLPDLESTRQALSWFFGMGMQKEFGGSIANTYPDFMKERLVEFIKPKQDKNGFFYHPQWDKAFTDTKPHRKGRDLTWATSMLEWCGARPTYDTPNGVKGDGLLANGERAEDYTPAAAEKSSSDTEPVAPELKDRESFVEYLSTLDVYNRSWHVGNLLESMGVQIAVRDETLRKEGADYSLSDILSEWLESRQNKELGLWGDNVCCYTVNGILKIASAYNKIKRPYPQISKGIEAAIAVIEGHESVTNICDVLNPWYAINVLLTNAREFGGAEEASKYVRYVFERAPKMIRVTKKRVLGFRKPDGSFSYLPKAASHISQGHPVTKEGTDEGDVNATMIATSAVIGHVFNLFGLARVPVFTVADRMRYMNIVEAKRAALGI